MELSINSDICLDCGVEFTLNDENKQCCPMCGAINENYIEYARDEDDVQAGVASTQPGTLF